MIYNKTYFYLESEEACKLTLEDFFKHSHLKQKLKNNKFD